MIGAVGAVVGARTVRRTRRVRSGAAWLAAAALLLAACGMEEEALRGPVLGSAVPAFSARNMEGEEVALADLEGRVVVLNVWATWCLPCLREVPGLERLHRAYGDRGLEVVGVSIDRGSARGAVARFVEQHGVTYPVLLDPDQDVSSTFRTIGVPETFLIDRDGVLAHRWIGEFDPDADEVIERVERLLDR